MTPLLNIALINAVTVLPLAVLAFVVSRWARRPALTHTLWVLVLLKFVTPPLFNLPVTIEVPQAAAAPSTSCASLAGRCRRRPADWDSPSSCGTD